METTRTRALASLAGTMPVANQQVAAGMQQARLMGLQTAATAAPAPGSGTPGTGVREAQAGGAAQTAEAGKIQVGVAQQGQQAAQEMGQGATRELAAGDVSALSTQRTAAEAATSANQSILTRMGQDAKQKLFDSRVQFQTDETGRTRFNETQLADWTVKKGQSTELLKQNMQKSEQAHAMKSQALKAAYQKVVEQLEMHQKQATQDRDQETTMKLAKAKQALEQKIAQDKADAANRQAMWQAGGTMVGTVVGAMVGGPAGAMAGGAVGGGAGSMIGGQVDSGTHSNS